ncbi:hypothetical protein JCM8097_007648 [Rhodosporidiobolus ruineniae]
MGIALWLCPASSSVNADLSTLLDDLSSQHGTPRFAPHVTLLSGIPSAAPLPTVLSRLGTALKTFRASSQPPLRLSFAQPDTRGTFFQFVFQHVEPGEALLHLRQAVRGEFMPEEAPKEDEYMPHLSLVYGETTETRTAEGIIREMQKDGAVKRVEGQRWSVRGHEGFEVGEVRIVKCDGRPEEWEVLDTVPL